MVGAGFVVELSNIGLTIGAYFVELEQSNIGLAVGTQVFLVLLARFENCPTIFCQEIRLWLHQQSQGQS